MKMKVRWRWKWNESYLTRTRRGERKRRGKEQTHTNTPSPERANPEKAREKKKAEADGNAPRPAEEGEDGSAWTNLPRRNLSLPRHTQDPNLPKGRRNAETHEKGDPWGTSSWHDAPTTHAVFVIRLKGPRLSIHNPLDGLRVQPLNYVHNWTSPTTIKRKKNHT